MSLRNAGKGRYEFNPRFASSTQATNETYNLPEKSLLTPFVPKTLIVTGGAGFIGSAVIRYLLSNTDTQVINLDKLTYAGNLESLSSVADSPNYVFEQVDICDHG